MISFGSNLADLVKNADSAAAQTKLRETPAAAAVQSEEIIPRNSISLSKKKTRPRVLNSRKEPEEEFFSMTLVAFVMSHPKKDQIIDLIKETESLYKVCRMGGNRPFYEWPGWIQSYIVLELKKISQRREKLRQARAPG